LPPVCVHAQIDIDPFSEEGWKFVEESLVSLCKNGGAKLIRLDAFGYVTKKAGTGCFMEVGNGCRQGSGVHLATWSSPTGAPAGAAVLQLQRLQLPLLAMIMWLNDFKGYTVCCWLA
jgi:hypothetical protein